MDVSINYNPLMFIKIAPQRPQCPSILIIILSVQMSDTLLFGQFLCLIIIYSKTSDVLRIVISYKAFLLFF